MITCPPPSTGAVATSPSLPVATGPLANEFAGATAAVPAEADALADGLADPDALADEPSADWLMFVRDPPEFAMTAPRVIPRATGMATGRAIRAARFRRVCRRRAYLFLVRINSPPLPALSLPQSHVIPAKTAWRLDLNISRTPIAGVTG